MEREYLDTREVKGIYFMKIVFNENKIIKDGFTLKEITNKLIDIMKRHNMYDPFLPDGIYGFGNLNDICQIYKELDKQKWFNDYVYEWIEYDQVHKAKVVHVFDGVRKDE